MSVQHHYTEQTITGYLKNVTPSQHLTCPYSPLVPTRHFQAAKSQKPVDRDRLFRKAAAFQKQFGVTRQRMGYLLRPN